MSDTTRQKTFETPLKFWQWAIEVPRERKAIDAFGNTFFVQEGQLTGKVFLLNEGTGINLLLDHYHCPMYAIHDENGPIEPLKEVQMFDKNTHTVFIWKSKESGEWYWNRKGANGEIVSTSGEGYKNKSHALGMAKLLNLGVVIRMEE